MLDFTSALYLGMRHPSGSLRPWKSLTTGVPAALSRPAETDRAATALAGLIGCDAGALATSTLHAFWDISGILSRDDISIYMDAGIYPIARWGAERAASKGKPVKVFPHHDSASLAALVKRGVGLRKPVVVTDGLCPGCGRAAPLVSYLDCIKGYGGCLVVDDTQALGILGDSPSPEAPYGIGGGGTLQLSGLKDPDVLVVSSLAKGFGVPVAVLAGSGAMLRRFNKESETMVHCSPPSAAVVHGAEHALMLNYENGEALRKRLAQLVRYFQSRMSGLGLHMAGGLFPVQTLILSPSEAVTLHKRLFSDGVKTVLRRGEEYGGPCLSFVITALHSVNEIDRAAEAIANAQSRDTLFRA